MIIPNIKSNVYETLVIRSFMQFIIAVGYKTNTASVRIIKCR